MKYLFIFLLSFSILTPSYSQDLGYEVTPTYRKSIKKEALNNAKTLKDINPDFPSSWIESYHSIIVTATCGNVLMTIESNIDQLNEQQRTALNNADIGTDIVVRVIYTPKNSTPDNRREINFTYRIVPETEASFSDDYQDLKAYLKANVIDQLSKEATANLQNAEVKFTIGTEGKPINPIVEISSKNKKTDQLLIDMINNMPYWSPAKLKNGSKINQDFVLIIGSMIGC